MKRNMELEERNQKLSKKHRGHHENNNSYNSKNDLSGSYDAEDRSFNDNSFSKAEAN